ncbi:MAG TPA: hypothetical protein VK989_11135, partial [Polyangia bacterium]|nr:hypothetical protein [Polyangia bacterium]
SKKRVVPGDPTHSYLYIKVSNTDTVLGGMNCGPAMPKAPNAALSSADQMTIHDWIMGGAKP